jgi:hypothetical protein
MTQSEYARHRGVSPVSVHKAIKSGRITTVDRDGQKMIDPDVADIQWEKNTRKRFQDAAVVVEQQQVGPDDDAQDAPSGAMVYDMALARAKREHHEANISEMKEREKAGTLIDRARTRKGAIDIASELRLALEQLPSKLSGRLAAESEASVVREVLADEIRGALAEAVARLRRLSSRENDDGRRGTTA